MTCECHGLPKVWQTDTRKKKGGYYRCFLKHVEFRRGHESYRKRELHRTTRAKRNKTLADLDAKINELISTHPFLKEVVSVS
jgi:hypothetical protein